ncbi:MAG: hypothetical protein AAFZ63_13620 [Bacteroidota bacterium]
MRSLFFLFLATLILSFAACSGDDDMMPANDLEGTWEAISFESETETNTDFNGMMTSSTAQIVGSNLNYQVTFNATTFTTQGDYDLAITTTVPPNPPFESSSSLTDVQGAGTYDIDGNQVTISGAFFAVEINGSPIDLSNEEQTATYEINANGELVFTQDEAFTNEQSGTTSTTIIRSTSVWRRL